MTTSALPRFVALVCLAVVAVRVSFATQPLRFDEAGYLIVARQWDGAGEFVYGDLWVDRPPGLLVLFKLAATFESGQAVRVLAIPFAVLFVVAAARAGWLLGGARAARLTTLIGAALVATPATGSDQADGELFAAPLVLASIVLMLEAQRRRTSSGRFWTAALAGALAVTAPLVKQSSVEALVFGAVLLTTTLLQRPDARRHVIPTAAGGSVGALLPIAAVAVWMRAGGVDLTALLQQVYGFRVVALQTIAEQPSSAPLERGLLLVGLATVTGILPILVLVGRAAWHRRLPGSGIQWAVGAVTVVSLVGVVAGGSYWVNYLLQLAPAAVLGAALLAGARASRWWLERVCAVAGASAVVASVGIGIVYSTVDWVWWPQRTGAWLASASRSGDTAVVAYGGSSVLESSDLATPYPYLWSLPVRVLDPDLDRLEATLRGPEAPTWVVQRGSFNAWGLDSDGGLRAAVDERYRPVAEVCSQRIWLRRDLTRSLPAPPAC